MGDVCHETGCTPAQCPNQRDGMCAIYEYRRQCSYTFMPTPDLSDIRAHCLRINESWSPQEELSRRETRSRRVPFEVQIIASLRDLICHDGR